MPSRRANRVTTRGRNNSQQVEDVTEVGSNQPNNAHVPGNARKRVRGPTMMPKVWTKTEEDRISVQFNEYGQPVKDTTSTLSHFIGSLARSGKYCKLHKPWNKVKNAKKQILLDTMHEQITFKPKRVLASQWKRLVKYWNKGKSKFILSLYVSSCSVVDDSSCVFRLLVFLLDNVTYKNSMWLIGINTCWHILIFLLKQVILGREPTRKELFRACFSKDGITKNEEAANAIEQMDELTSQLSEHELDEPGPQDIHSKVMGNDKNGTVEMYGLGVRASDVWGVVPSRSARRKDKLQWKSTAEQLSIELDEYKGREA
ncbi:hypothetical protein Tco_0398238 [Tanacetum coccineum]